MPSDTESPAAFGLELAAATDAARAGGAAIREVFGRPHAVTYKTGDDPLTAADSASDRCIRDRLRSAFPRDGWLSEEGDARQGADVGRVWVVDPLDGTREFVQHIPEFAVSIALTVDGRPVVAVVYNPIRDQLVSAVRDGGVHVDGRSVAASDTADLATAVVLASRSEVSRGDWEPFEGRCRVRPTGSVAYKMALVAIGEADATISLAPKHGWDVCAGILLVEEAGGRASLLDGRPLDMTHPAALIDGLIASNAELHAQILAAVAVTPRPA
ncbi:MAG: 3'(2'),5'-bisphosphate nucleotidase CysQ [Candidatus Limnocylindrales bacterium]